MTERLRNGRLDGALVDVTISDGVIVGIDPADAIPAPAGMTITYLDGRVVMPPTVNGHAHLDKTFWGSPWRAHRPGRSVHERIAHERAIRAEESVPQLPRALALGRAMARAGVGAIRTHVDIDSLVRLDGLEAVLAAREALADAVEIQIVAFPQSGVLADTGVVDLMEAAITSGADLVGGLDPVGIDSDMSAHLDIIFRLAEKHGVGLDIHLHDTGHPGLKEIEEICVRTIALGAQGRVAISHAFALGSVPISEMQSTADILAEAGVSVMTNGPVGTTPPVRALRAAGVTVFTGSDGIRDAWSPYGSPSMTAVARQLSYQSEFYEDIDLETVADITTQGGATALGLRDYGIRRGGPADLVVFEASTVAEVIASAAPANLVLRAGRRV
jgi:cytosine deaminase